MRIETATHLQVILDCMTGADGGVAFVKFREWLQACDAQAASGDPASKELVAMVERFSRLIQVATK